MRIVIAQMSHETNTFSPVITDLARFSGPGEVPLSGAAALQTFRGTASCMGGYLQVAEAAGAEIIIPVTAAAKPSGPVEDARKAQQHEQAQAELEQLLGRQLQVDTYEK